MPEENDLNDQGDEDEDDGEIPWETQARESLERAAEEVSFDEVRGVVYLRTGEDQRLNLFDEGFSSVDKLRQRLTQIAEQEWVAYVPYDHGEPVYEPEVEDMVEDIIDRHGLESFFERVEPPDEEDELANAKDLTLPGAGLALQIDVVDINEELVSYLAQHPEKMYDMQPRRFEELVAELFRAKGYEVELTPRTRDGGIDIRAVHRSDIGTSLFLIECKRYGPDHPVTVEIVRGVYGVAESEKATRGIIVTTSRFTRDAQAFQAQNQYRLELAAFNRLKEWLREYRRRP